MALAVAVAVALAVAVAILAGLGSQTVWGEEIQVSGLGISKGTRRESG